MEKHTFRTQALRMKFHFAKEMGKLILRRVTSTAGNKRNRKVMVQYLTA